MLPTRLRLSPLATAALLAITVFPFVGRAQPVGESTAGGPAVGGPAIQEVHLKEGWNRVGLHVLPTSTTFADIFGETLPHIFLVRDGAGRIYSPRFGVSDVDRWDWREGYSVFADTSVVFEVHGATIVTAGSPVPLRAGWNLFPYFGPDAVSAEEVLAPLAGGLVGVLGEDGRYADDPSVLPPFRSGGAYLVKLGRADTLLFTANPPNAAPVAAFSTQCSDLACSFTDASSDSDGQIVTRSWSFGDGSAPDTTRSPAHAYAAAGTYTVRLDVSDEDGAAGSYQANVEVAAPAFGFYGTEAVPWGPDSKLYAPTYNPACQPGDVHDAGACVPVEAWLASRGFTSVCTVDDDGAEDPDADASTIRECGYGPGRATVLRAGTYREDVRPTSIRFALVAYPGERPVVSGSDVVEPGGWTDEGGGVWRHPWVWEPLDNGDGALRASERREVFVVDGHVLDQLGGAARPAVSDGEFWVEGTPSHPTAVYANPPDETDPNEAVVEVGQRWQLFWPSDVRGQKCHESSQSGHLVAGVAFRHGTSRRQHHGLCLGGADGVLLDAEVSWQNGGAVDLDGSDHVVLGSRLNYNGVEGPGGTGAHGGLVAFSEVRGNGWEEEDGGHGGGGKFTRTRGLVVRNNVYAENHVNGLWLDFRNRDVVVSANLFDRNVGTGLFLELFSDSVVVANNVFFAGRLRPHSPQGSARLQGSIKVIDSNSAVVAYNTVVAASNAAVLIGVTDRSEWPCAHDGDPQCGPDESPNGKNEGAPDADGSPPRSRDHRVYNNVLMADPPRPYLDEAGRTVYPRSNSVFVGGVGSDDEQSIEWRGNLSWDKGLEGSSSRTYHSVPSGVNVNAYEDWVLSVDALGGASFADPLRVLADVESAAGALSLPPGSLSVEAGTPIPGTVFLLFDEGPTRDAAVYALTHDAWGRVRGSSPSVGAVEGP